MTTWTIILVLGVVLVIDVALVVLAWKKERDRLNSLGFHVEELEGGILKVTEREP